MEQAEPELKTAFLVIEASINGRDLWHPVHADELPDWVRDPDNMGRMVAGDMCMKADEGEAGSLWYRARLGG